MQDTEGKSLKNVLEENRPSFDFHRKIWEWFGKKLLDS
jgi:hypothetical protein